LHVETLPELYAAVRQGRLDQVPGIGRKRARAIRDALSLRIRKDHPQGISLPDVDRSVSVAEILDIDAQYRQLSSEDKLPKIAPSKFNPGNIAWLPILHTDRDGRHYSALFSNTARAHDLNTTKDWVVIYRDDANSHGRWTVITSQFGKLQGCRIVRGREAECLTHSKPT
jgi:putative hydrolase